MLHVCPNFLFREKPFLKFAHKYFWAVSCRPIVLKLNFWITLFSPNMVRPIRIFRLVCKPRMSNFDAITAEVTIFGHRAV